MHFNMDDDEDDGLTCHSKFEDKMRKKVAKE